MGVVSVERLHRYMSSPNWSAAQRETAEGICEAVESDLCAALYGAVITPQQRDESVDTADDGRILTSLPIYRLLSLGGAVLVPDVEQDPDLDLPLPAGYALKGGWLRSTTMAAAYDSPGVRREPWHPSSFVAAPLITALWPVSRMTISYLGGWGPDPALTDAIMRKAAARMGNRHSDAMGVVGLTAETPSQKPAVEHFTDDDMRSLSRFRALGWGS